jgi:adenosylcobinamide-GDP ribazoletransferase
LIIFVVGTTLTLFLVAISTRSFGGITGDVLGSTNELSRLASLLVFVSI